MIYLKTNENYEVYGTITIPVCFCVKAYNHDDAIKTANHLINDYNVTMKQFNVEANGNTYSLITNDGGVVNWITAFHEDDI